MKDNNIRSANGKYSIMYATNTSATTYAADFITVKGFNLNPSAVRIVDTAIATTKLTAPTGTTVTFSGTADDYTSFSAANTIDNSGYLEVFVNAGTTDSPVYIRSLNNVNNNNSYGTATNTSNTPLTSGNASVDDYVKAYNREPDFYTTKNVLLTDDRYLIMWDMHNTGDRTANGAYPTMFMEGDKPVFGYFNPSGGPVGAVGDGPGTGAGRTSDSTYLPSGAMPQRIKFNEDGTEAYTEYLAKNSAGDQMGTGRDDSGRYYHISVFNRSACAMYMIYDRFEEFYTASKGWAPGVGYGTTVAGGYVGRNNNTGIALESIDYDSMLIGRYQYPKIIAKGRSKDATAYVYVAYYDEHFHSIVMRTFQCGTTVTGGTANDLYGYDTDRWGNITTWYNDLADNMDSPNTSSRYEQKINFTENTCTSAPSATYYTGRLSGVGRVLRYNDGGTTEQDKETSSHFFDMKVTSDYHIILIYYDDDNSKLKLRYSTNPITGNAPTTNIAWTESTIDFPEYVGNYVSLDLDGNDGLHIAAYDATDGNLVYMYLPTYSSRTFTQVTVDQASAVGNWTQVKVNSNNIPYIAYYNSTETGSRDSIKLAYAKAAAGSVTAGVDVVPGQMTGTGYTLGGWEYMTIPAVTPPQGGNPNFQNVCLDFDSNGLPVVGYAASSLEFGKQRSE